MPTPSLAAIYRKDQDGLSIEEITVDDPLEREVLIRSVATGVCHSDLHVIDGHINAGRGPLVLGHEGAGIVQAVGAGVTHVKPGDHVVTCLSGFCGQCDQCLAGHPNLCVANPTARTRDQASRLMQGDQRVFAFAGLASFAEVMLVHEHSVVKIDEDLPFDVASLVGCGVLTGVGAALRTAKVQAGQTVAVFGCGGVGLSIIQGAALAGASRIIAVDQTEAKLDLARSVGATDGVNASDVPAVEAVRELTGGRGVDHSFEAVGIPALVRQAAEVLAVRGTCTIVGVPPDGAVFEIPFAAIRPECTIQTSRMGSTRFRLDIPRYLDFYKAGRLHLDQIITRRARLDDINDIVASMHAADGARTVIVFDQQG